MSTLMLKLLPKLTQKAGCSTVLQSSPPSVLEGPLGQATHLQPFVVGPETDTKVTLTISTGPKAWLLEADLCDTVDQIKKRLMEDGKFCASGSFGLVYGSKELQGPMTLAQHGVTSLATLFIFHKCHGG